MLPANKRCAPFPPLFIGWYVRRTLELDKPLGFNDDGTEVTFELADEGVNIENAYADSERQDAIAEVIGTLDTLTRNCGSA